MKNIPYSHQSIDKADIKEVVKVLESDWITQGPKIKEFEDALCKYTGAKYAVVVSNGTAALHVACLAAGINTGDEVITSPITFAASANCILYCQGRPVFADIQKDTANIDPAEIKINLKKKTKAIIPVHFAGHPVDLKEIYDIAKKKDLMIIEDAAHALGATYKGEKIGSCRYSDMAVFSFHPVKSITTGEGGAVLTNRRDLYDRLSMFRNHGITRAGFLNNRKIADCGWYYEMQELGFNYRLTDFQCALGINQLRRLNKLIDRRREIIGIYNEKLSCIPEIDLPVEKSHVRSSWHLYCIRLKDQQKRKYVFNKLRDSGLGVQVHYIPVYWHPYYQKLGYAIGLCPNGEDFYSGTISIPLYPDMRDRDIDYVIDRVVSAF